MKILLQIILPLTIFAFALLSPLFLKRREFRGPLLTSSGAFKTTLSTATFSSSAKTVSTSTAASSTKSASTAVSEMTSQTPSASTRAPKIATSAKTSMITLTSASTTASMTTLITMSTAATTAVSTTPSKTTLPILTTELQQECQSCDCKQKKNCLIDFFGNNKETECRDRGCRWCENQNEEPKCIKGPKPEQSQCNLENNEKADCGFFGIT